MAASPPKLDYQSWNQRWQDKNIPWHRSYVEPLVKVGSDAYIIDTEYVCRGNVFWKYTLTYLVIIHAIVVCIVFYFTTEIRGLAGGWAGRSVYSCDHVWEECGHDLAV